MKKFARALLLGASLAAFTPGLARADGPPAFPGFWFGGFGGAFSANDLLGGTAGSFTGAPALADPAAGAPVMAATFGPGDLMGGMSQLQASDPVLMQSQQSLIPFPESMSIALPQMNIDMEKQQSLGDSGNVSASSAVDMQLLGETVMTAEMLSSLQSLSSLSAPMSPGQSLSSILGPSSESIAPAPISSDFTTQVSNLLNTFSNPTTPASATASTPSAPAWSATPSILDPADLNPTVGGYMAIDPKNLNATNLNGTDVNSILGVQDGQGSTGLDGQGNTDGQGNAAFDDAQGTTDFIQGVMDGGSFGEDGFFGEDGLGDVDGGF